MALNLPVLLGTVREGRRSEHVARYAHARLAARPGIVSALIDPRRLPFGNLVGRVKDLPELDAAAVPEIPVTPEIRQFVLDMHAADGFLVVTPEYNYSIPGALKNLFDVTFKPWNRKPFAVVGCGGESGGLRAIDALRQTVAGLAAVSVPTHLPVFHVEKAFGPDGPLDKATFDKRFDKVCEQLEWYAAALKAARQQASH